MVSLGEFFRKYTEHLKTEDIYRKVGLSHHYNLLFSFIDVIIVCYIYLVWNAYILFTKFLALFFIHWSNPQRFFWSNVENVYTTLILTDHYFTYNKCCESITALTWTSYSPCWLSGKSLSIIDVFPSWFMCYAHTNINSNKKFYQHRWILI